MTTETTAPKYYLLATDDNPTPRIADFAALFPDGAEHGTTSEEVAALEVADLYHAGAWAVVRCDLAILDAARDADDILADVRGAPRELADDETLAAAYLADRRANRERALVAAAIRRLGPGVAADALRTAAGQLAELGAFVDQLELVPGFMPRSRERARAIGNLREIADRLDPPPALTVRELAKFASALGPLDLGPLAPPRDEAALLRLAELLAGASPGEVEIDALAVDGAVLAGLRWNGASWAGVVGDVTPPRLIDSLRFRRAGCYPATVRARDLVTPAISRVVAADTFDLKLGLTLPDGSAWPVADAPAPLPRAVARHRERFPTIPDAQIQAGAALRAMLTAPNAAAMAAGIMTHEIEEAAAYERDRDRARFASGDFAIGDDRATGYAPTETDPAPTACTAAITTTRTDRTAAHSGRPLWIVTCAVHGMIHPGTTGPDHWRTEHATTGEVWRS